MSARLATLPALEIASGNDAAGDALALPSQVDDYLRLAMAILAPEPSESLWDWCCRYLQLYNGNRFDPRRAKLIRYWYRVIDARLNRRPLPGDEMAHLVEQVWLIAAAQIAKSTLLYAVVAYVLRHLSRRIGFYTRRKGDTDESRTGRLQPMLEMNEQLSALLPQGQEARERALAARRWQVNQSTVFWQAGNVADDWRMHDLDLEALDEFERFDQNVGGFGDPIDSGLVRMRGYPQTRLMIGTTSPGLVSSHGWRRLCTGSHQRLMVECPHCGGADPLDDDQVVLAGGRQFEEVESKEIRLADLGRYECPRCHTLWHERDLYDAVEVATDRELWVPGTWEQSADHPQGHWEPHGEFESDYHRLVSYEPPRSFIRSGWMPSLYATAVMPLSHFAAVKAVALQGTESARQAYLNNEAAKPYTMHITTADVDDIAAHAGADYPVGRCPHGDAVLLLVMDQQGNTPELFNYPWVLIAAAPGLGTWRVDCGHAKNDEEAVALETRTWLVGNRLQQPFITTRDSANGNAKFWLYQWAAENPSKRALIYGDSKLTGTGIRWEAMADQPNRRRRVSKPANVREWRMDPHLNRSLLWDRILGKSDQPWRYPAAFADERPFYLKSLTSEEPLEEMRKVTGQGHQPVVIWKPRVIEQTDERVIVRRDNHWWDCEAMATALVDIFDMEESDQPDTTTTPEAYRSQADTEYGGGDGDGWLGGLGDSW